MVGGRTQKAQSYTKGDQEDEVYRIGLRKGWAKELNLRFIFIRKDERIKSIKRGEYISFPRIFSSPPRSLLEKWRGQRGVQQTTAKLANLSLMFVSLSSAEFQGNGFSAAEQKRVSIEKNLLLWNKTFWGFLWQWQGSTRPRQQGSCVVSNLRRTRRCYDLDTHKNFCLFSAWQERLCLTLGQEMCSSMEFEEEWTWSQKLLWNCKPDQNGCPYQLQVLLSLSFLTSVFMSLFIAQNVPAAESTSN